MLRGLIQNPLLTIPSINHRVTCREQIPWVRIPLKPGLPGKCQRSALRNGKPKWIARFRPNVQILIRMEAVISTFSKQCWLHKYYNHLAQYTLQAFWFHFLGVNTNNDRVILFSRYRGLEKWDQNVNSSQHIATWFLGQLRWCNVPNGISSLHRYLWHADSILVSTCANYVTKLAHFSGPQFVQLGLMAYLYGSSNINILWWQRKVCGVESPPEMATPTEKTTEDKKTTIYCSLSGVCAGFSER